MHTRTHTRMHTHMYTHYLEHFFLETFTYTNMLFLDTLCTYTCKCVRCTYVRINKQKEHPAQTHVQSPPELPVGGIHEHMDTYTCKCVRCMDTRTDTPPLYTPNTWQLVSNLFSGGEKQDHTNHLSQSPVC